jgi:short-subunit dehydrogenase
MAKTALVTGATAGIGAAFARLLAREGHDLVLVARDEARLATTAAALASEFNIHCEILMADLSTEIGVAQVEKRILDGHPHVDVLINNAGFGIRDSFLSSGLKAELELLDVLVRAPMRLMHAVLPGMKDRNLGTIINVSSVAGWTAGGSYSAAKSYLTVLSESLHTELRRTDLRILALAPGFTHTEFHSRANMRMGALPEFLWLDADKVVTKAWADAGMKKAISVPGRQYSFISMLARFGPRPLVRKLGMTVRIKQRPK